MNAKEYRKLLEVEFDEVKLDDMPDLAKIRIDHLLPQEKRQEQHIRKVGNPHLSRIGIGKHIQACR